MHIAVYTSTREMIAALRRKFAAQNDRTVIYRLIIEPRQVDPYVSAQASYTQLSKCTDPKNTTQHATIT